MQITCVALCKTYDTHTVFTWRQMQKDSQSVDICYQVIRTKIYISMCTRTGASPIQKHSGQANLAVMFKQSLADTICEICTNIIDKHLKVK